MSPAASLGGQDAAQAIPAVGNGMAAQPGAHGIGGLAIPKIDGRMSQRASVTSEIVLDDVRIPQENLLPNAQGLKSWLGCRKMAGYGIPWGAMGPAEDCLAWARRYTLQRE